MKNNSIYYLRNKEKLLEKVQNRYHQANGKERAI